MRTSMNKPHGLTTTRRGNQNGKLTSSPPTFTDRDWETDLMPVLVQSKLMIFGRIKKK
jgi:hypothetical protein